ncbi:MAG: tetratricopeptide repeat protein [Aggregatilineales bacterium]
MADINLKQYLSRLDQHIQNGAFDEALYHSRHILKHFPKNIAAYRVLGRALLEEGRWQQAGEVLRRVLSVEPDNFDAFVGLSQIYERLKRPDEAIWYLERAFEQRPNSQALTQKLRDLYAEYYKRQVDKINLTAGAVARQYKNNGLYDQALDVLQRNLQRYPNRADLRILMARVYREGERPIEAAEVAQDLLEQLPDCLEANVLLAKVWLAVDRPSDAQRHISRIEPVAPYVALEIVQGGVPDEDAFMLSELDYQAVAARELASNSPDWLTSIEESEEIELDIVADEISDDDGDADVASWLRDDDSPTGMDEADDWLSEVESMDTKVNEAKTMPIPPPMVKRERTGKTGLLSSLEPNDPTPEAPTEPQITDEFDDIFALDDMPESALADELKVDGIDLFGDFDLDEDTLNGEVIDLFGDDDFELDDAEDDADPMAWLQESGLELVDDIEDEETVTGMPAELSQVLPSSDTADPMAWLKDSGVEIVEGSGNFDEFLDEVDELQDPETAADPMAWLKDSGVEIIADDASGEFDLFSDLDSGILKSLPDDEDDDSDDADPMAWLKDSGIDVVEDDVLESPAELPQAVNPDNELDWLADDELLDEMLDIESFSSEEGFITGSLENKLPMQGEDSTELPSPDGQDDMSTNENEFPDDWFDDDSSEDWMGEGQPADTPETVSGISADDLFGEDSEESDDVNWMNDVQVEADAFALDTSTSAETLFDSMDDDAEDEDSESSFEDVVEPALFGDMDSGLSWQNDASAVSESMQDSEDLDDDSLPDWLGSASDDDDDDDSTFAVVGETDDDAEDLFSFDLESDEDESEGMIELAGEDAADWMAELNVDNRVEFPAENAQNNENDSEDAEDEDLFGEMFTDGADAAEMPISDGSANDETPEWLMNNSPNFADSDGDEEEFSWELENDSDEEEGTVEEGVPDWLASVGGDLDDADDDAEEFEEDIVAFGSASAFGDMDADDAEDDVMPDWLSGAAPILDDDDDSEEFEEDIVAFGSASAFGDTDEDDDESLESARPEWLSAVGGADANDDDEEFEEDFLAFDDEEESDEATGGMPDWLAGAAPTLDAEDDDEEEFAESIVAFGGEADSDEDDDEAFSWGGGEEEAAVAGDVPEWLSAVASAESEEDDEYGDEESDDEEDFLEFDLELEDEAVAEDGGVPDWLAGSAPTLDAEDDDEEEEFAESIVAFGGEADSDEDDDEAFSWGGEEEPDAVAGDVPEWLSAVGGAESEEDEESDEEDFLEFDVEDEEAAEEDAYQPIVFGASEMVTEDDEDEEDAFSWGGEESAAVADEVPEWLSAVGGAESDDGDEESEEDFLEFDVEHEEIDEEDAVPDWLSGAAPILDSDEEEFEEDIVAFGAGDFVTEDDEEEYEPVAFGAGDTVDEYGNEWDGEDDQDDDADLVGAVPDWIASSAVEDSPDNDDYEEAYEEAYDNNSVSFGVGDTILQDAQEAGESLPLAEAPPLDDELPVDVADWQEENVAYSAGEVDYSAEAVPLGDALPVEEDQYTDSFMGAGASNLLYEESRAGILDEPMSGYDAESIDFDDVSSQAQSLDYDTIDEDRFIDESDEIDALPADNAPDWLNTMVPGLDIDFEAAEDAPIETEFADDLTAHRRAQVAMTGGNRTENDMEWLTDIVDEETSQPPTLPGTDYLPDDDRMADVEDEFDLEPEPQQKRRFVFSRPPLWLRRRSQAQDVQEVEENPDTFDFDDELDEIGEDLPPWLDYDDDEF